MTIQKLTGLKMDRRAVRLIFMKGLSLKKVCVNTVCKVSAPSKTLGKNLLRLFNIIIVGA